MTSGTFLVFIFFERDRGFGEMVKFRFGVGNVLGEFGLLSYVRKEEYY